MKLQEIWREAFAPDCGMLLDIRVYGSSDADYQILLPFLASRFCARYVRDGVESEVPDYCTIISDYEKASVFVKIDVAGVQVNQWFHFRDEMNLDLLPNDVDSVEKAEGIIEFAKAIANLLNRRVLLTAENASADQEWAERHYIFSARPSDEKVEYGPDLNGWSRY